VTIFRLVNGRRHSQTVSIEGLKHLKGLAPGPKLTPLMAMLESRGLDIAVADSTYEALEALAAGEIDYVVSDRFILRSVAVSMAMLQQIWVVDFPGMVVRRFHFAAVDNERGRDLIRLLDKSVGALKDKGYMAHLNRSHLQHWLAVQSCGTQAR